MRTTPRLVLIWGLPLLLAGAALAAIHPIEDHQDIEGPFTDGPSVTAACIECHDDVGHDFMQTSHWTWEPMQDIIGKGRVSLGKKNMINNFCVALNSNWARCTSCHPGYGWADDSFDFSNPENIDCLICHDQTGKYRKFPTGAGHPVYEPKEWAGKIWEPLDLAGLARTAGAPTRSNCGACHFSGGGGNNVKHGDMEKALADPPVELDVHMSADGQDFTCTECHTTTDHDIAGNAMFASPGGSNHLECTSCHDDDLHDKRILNWHTKSVACQVCHIPTFARANPTKTWWDWSTAGTNAEVTKDENGMALFDKKKGHFEWDTHVVPTYAWYDGISTQYLLGENMNPDEVTHLNHPQGDRLDPKSKIHAFKVMRGKQPYDAQARVILVPKLFGKTGFWKTWDWNAAFEQGMASVEMEYSGEYGFAETDSYWKINHMVAPADDALKCAACHAKSGPSRMDWEALGYDGDPSKKRGVSRYELKTAYDDVNQ